jgi:hypothetical protein
VIRAMRLACIGALLAAPAAAQTNAAASPPAQPAPFAITDNAFLIEEAFNQDAGVVQNIFQWSSKRDGVWSGNFTQEWPLRGIRHQISYTLPFSGGSINTAFDSVIVNYRYQGLEEGPGRPAFAPRFSVIMNTRRDDAAENVDLQINLPFSKQVGDFYFHWSGGLTWGVDVPRPGLGAGTLTSPQVAGSVIWRMRPMFHLMLENVLDYDGSFSGSSTVHDATYTLAPGFRWGWNFGERQVVIGAAMTFEVFKDAATRAAGLTYLSYELPFVK